MRIESQLLIRSAVVLSATAACLVPLAQPAHAGLVQSGKTIGRDSGVGRVWFSRCGRAAGRCTSVSLYFQAKNRVDYNLYCTLNSCDNNRGNYYVEWPRDTFWGTVYDAKDYSWAGANIITTAEHWEWASSDDAQRRRNHSGNEPNQDGCLMPGNNANFCVQARKGAGLTYWDPAVVGGIFVHGRSGTTGHFVGRYLVLYANLGNGSG